MSKNTDKLEALAKDEGITVAKMIENAICDSIVPGICMNDNCNATYNYEADQREGYCEECKSRTVESCLSLYGVA